MAEEEVGKHPPSLYNLCLSTYVSNLNYNVKTLDNINNLRLLPSILLSDIYVKMSYTEKLKNLLMHQLTDLDVFARLLRLSSTRQHLFRCVSSLMSSGKPLVSQLNDKYVMKYELQNSNRFPDEVNTKVPPTFSNNINGYLSDAFDMDAIDLGLRLSSFLSEAGWLIQSISVLYCISVRLEQFKDDYFILLLRLDCLQRLLHSEAVYGNFKTAQRTYDTLLNLLKNSGNFKIPDNLLANIFRQFSEFFFSRSEFDSSFKWSILAMRYLKKSAPERLVVDVLRQAAKSCVVKRQFKRANMLICQAVRRARNTFGKNHQKYSDALLDYGFFLLNVDSVYQSVKMYREALEIKRRIFGNHNFNVAIAHEDLSYAYYVYEYSSGEFQYARENVERAIDILKYLVPSNHLKLASAKRVKALLLEEIALDKIVTDPNGDGESLLLESEELHKCALQLSLEAFGEINVQTAKHYGNLGRLYQSMSKFEEAEQMHKKAIKIKTDLLGPFDYEVGLSIGHLASLYNYHMQKYREAEKLYLKSIEISLQLFGKTYSGLEYDYLGLCHVYETTNNVPKYLQYAQILENWQMLRDENNVANKSIYPELRDDKTLEEFIQSFFEMCSAAEGDTYEFDIFAKQL